MAAVKVRRTRRQEQATATRRRIVDAGYRLFSDDGYASATMEAIAAASGVAVQTVYHVFNTKALLLKEVTQVAAAGQHDAPPEPEWLAESLEATDGRRGLALMIEQGISSSVRVAPLIGAINAAASTDPAFADFWDASCTARRNGTAASSPVSLRVASCARDWRPNVRRTSSMRSAAMRPCRPSWPRAVGRWRT